MVVERSLRARAESFASQLRGSSPQGYKSTRSVARTEARQQVSQAAMRSKMMAVEDELVESREAERRLRDQNVKLQERLTIYKKQHENNLTTVDDERSKLHQELGRSLEQNEELRKEVDLRETAIQNLTDQLRLSEAVKQGASNDLERLRAEVEALRADLFDCRECLRKAERQLTKERDASSASKNDYLKISREKEQLDAKVASLSARLEEFEDSKRRNLAASTYHEQRLVYKALNALRYGIKLQKWELQRIQAAERKRGRLRAKRCFLGWKKLRTQGRDVEVFHKEVVRREMKSAFFWLKHWGLSRHSQKVDLARAADFRNKKVLRKQMRTWLLAARDEFRRKVEVAEKKWVLLHRCHLFRKWKSYSSWKRLRKAKEHALFLELRPFQAARFFHSWVGVFDDTSSDLRMASKLHLFVRERRLLRGIKSLKDFADSRVLMRGRIWRVAVVRFRCLVEAWKAYKDSKKRKRELTSLGKIRILRMRVNSSLETWRQRTSLTRRLAAQARRVKEAVGRRQESFYLNLWQSAYGEFLQEQRKERARLQEEARKRLVVWKKWIQKRHHFRSLHHTTSQAAAHIASFRFERSMQRWQRFVWGRKKVRNFIEICWARRSLTLLIRVLYSWRVLSREDLYGSRKLEAASREREFLALEEKAKGMEMAIREREDANAATLSELSSISGILAENEERARTAEGRAEGLEAALGQREAIMEGLKVDLSNSRSQVERLQAENSSLRGGVSSALEEKNRNLITAREQLDVAKSEVSSLRKDLAEKDEIILSLHSKIEEAQSERKRDLKVKQKQIEEEIEVSRSLRSVVRALEEEASLHVEEVSSLKSQLSEAEQRAQAKEKEAAMAMESEEELINQYKDQLDASEALVVQSQKEERATAARLKEAQTELRKLRYQVELLERTRASYPSSAPAGQPREKVPPLYLAPAFSPEEEEEDFRDLQKGRLSSSIKDLERMARVELEKEEGRGRTPGGDEHTRGNDFSLEKRLELARKRNSKRVEIDRNCMTEPSSPFTGVKEVGPAPPALTWDRFEQIEKKFSELEARFAKPP